jgi:hypothetical protein
MRGSIAMTCDGVHAAVIRQAAHDAVRVLLAAPPGSLTGSLALRQVTTWLVAEHGAAAVTDLAEELAADLAKALDAFAAAEGRPALAVLDCWFHDVPPPWDGSTIPETAATADPDEADPGEAPGVREVGQKPTRGGSAS